MKKTFTLTTDHFISDTGTPDAYYCETPTNRQVGFRLCVDKVNKWFPDTLRKKTIVVTISTVKQKKPGEVEASLRFSYVPFVVIEGEHVQILSQTYNNVGIPIKDGDVFYVTINPASSKRK